MLTYKWFEIKSELIHLVQINEVDNGKKTRVKKCRRCLRLCHAV